MKLIFAIKGLNNAKGGAERVICQISSALAERGYEVSLLSFDKPNGKTFYPLSNKVRRIEIGIGNTHKKTTIKEFFRRLISLRRIMKQEAPDIVIPFMYSMYVPMTFSLLGTGIRILGSEHNTADNYKGKPLQFLSLIISVIFMKKCTVLSEKVKQTFSLIVRNKMVSMVNPVICPEKINKDSNTNIILNVGSLTPQKDQKTLIKAFSIVVKKYPDWSLRIVGEGELKVNLQQLINQLGVGKNVLLVDGTDKIEREYCRAQLFVISSLFESFGLVTAEAMAFGLPVIGFSDCSGTNELIEHEVNGILVSGIDRVDSLAKGIERLISDKKLCEQMVGKGLIFVKQFSIDVVADRWQELVNQI